MILRLCALSLCLLGGLPAWAESSKPAERMMLMLASQADFEARLDLQVGLLLVQTNEGRFGDAEATARALGDTLRTASSLPTDFGVFWAIKALVDGVGPEKALPLLLDGPAGEPLRLVSWLAWSGGGQIAIRAAEHVLERATGTLDRARALLGLIRAHVHNGGAARALPLADQLDALTAGTREPLLQKLGILGQIERGDALVKLGRPSEAYTVLRQAAIAIGGDHLELRPAWAIPKMATLAALGHPHGVKVVAEAALSWPVPPLGRNTHTHARLRLAHTLLLRDPKRVIPLFDHILQPTSDFRLFIEVGVFVAAMTPLVDDQTCDLKGIVHVRSEAAKRYGADWPELPRLQAIEAAQWLHCDQVAQAEASLAPARLAVGATPDHPYAALVHATAARLSAAKGARAAAIWHGKQAIDALQQRRAAMKGLDGPFVAAFLATHRPVYVALADHLVAEGRLSEAQHVLDLLKHAEFEDYTRTQRANDAPAPRTKGERSADRRIRIVRGPLMQLAGRPSRHPEGDARLAAARRHYLATLEYIEDRLVATRRRAALRGRKLTELPELPAALDLDDETGLLHVVVTPTRLHLLLTAKGTQIARSVEVAQTTLNAEIAALQRALRSPAAPFEAPAEALYRRLIAPIRGELNAAGVETLAVSLDAALRYIPLAALRDPDTHRFLVQDFALARFGVAARAALSKPTSHRPLTVAALGAAKHPAPLAPLRAVPDELEAIVRRDADDPDGVVPGSIALDEAFTPQALQAAVGRDAAAVHLATHFMFVPGADTESYLALGNGRRLTVADVRTGPYRFDGVSLLTLSACNTAAGIGEDGRELDGFAAVAHGKGAEAVLATLWPVADRATAQFMTRFYDLLSVGFSRAWALRTAQRAMIRGVGPGKVDATTRGFHRPKTQAEGWRAPVDKPYAHPYYWAPFILMGDWR